MTKPIQPGKRVSPWACVLVVLTACTGTIEDSARGPAAGADGQGATADPNRPDSVGNVPGDPDAAGPLPLRRLTRVEYDHVASALLGKQVSLGKTFPSEPTGSSGFATPGQMSDVDASLYGRAAEDLANALTADLSRILPCSTSLSDVAEEDTCIGELLRSFGTRVYRRPLSESEVADHLSLFGAVRRGELAYDFTGATRVLLTAMLQAPDFLYHWETDPKEVNLENGAVRLDPYQIASRLSFFLWQSMPDDTLLSAAAEGRLANEAQVEAEARRLIDDPRALDGIASFFPQWLRLDAILGAERDPTLYPEFGPSLTSAMTQEVFDLARHLTIDTEGTLPDLLTTRLSFVNGELATLYGVEGVAADRTEMRMLDETRAGLLSRAAVLTVGSNAYEGDPTKRGKLIREQVLCQTLAAPPPGIPPLPPPSDLTIRERHEQHVADPACNGCHRLTDPIGFGFGNFDAIGRFAELEQGAPIDASGQVTNLDGESPSFVGSADLATLLSQSDEVNECFLKQWFRFAMGRKEEPLDQGSLHATWKRFEASNYQLRELLIALTVSRSFRYRALEEGEPLP